MFLIDMGFFMSRSLFRVTKDSEDSPYTPAQRDNLDFMAKEAARDFGEYLKTLLTEQKAINEETGKPNYFILCFDDNTYQVRPSYKQRTATPATAKVIKQKMYDIYMNTLKNTKSLKIANGFGMEADDWAFCFSRNPAFKDFDITVITSDRDWLCNITENCGGIFYGGATLSDIHRSSWETDVMNFKDYQQMPYNAIWLYKITVGDKSDSIDGVKGFGPKAFQKVIEGMKTDNYPFENLHRIEIFEEFLDSPDGLVKYLAPAIKKSQNLEECLTQAKEAWSLVRPVLLEEAKTYYEGHKEEIEQKKEARKEHYKELLVKAQEEIAQRHMTCPATVATPVSSDSDESLPESNPLSV